MLAGKSRVSHKSRYAPMTLALTVSIFAQTIVVVPAQALSFIATKRSAQLQTPVEEKLDSAPSADSSSTASGAASEPVNLAPLSLSDEKVKDTPDAAPPKKAASDDSEQSDKGYMKLEASQNQFVPKGPIGEDGNSIAPGLPVKSMKSEISSGKNKLMDQAKQVNIMPIPLQENNEEIDKKVLTQLDADREQIAGLWEATLTQSKDIQFVVQKLMPTSDTGRTTTLMLRLLSSAALVGVSTISAVNPTPGSYMLQQGGGSMLMQVLGAVDSKQQKKAQISQTEAISLYQIVRNTADKMVDNYRDYKKSVSKLDRCLKNLQNLQTMIAEARAGQDAAKQLDMEYTLSKAQGDVEDCNDDARRHRQQLIDLAGAAAVERLDQQIADQQSLPKDDASNVQIVSSENNNGVVPVAEKDDEPKAPPALKEGAGGFNPAQLSKQYAAEKVAKEKAAKIAKADAKADAEKKSKAAKTPPLTQKAQYAIPNGKLPI